MNERKLIRVRNVITHTFRIMEGSATVEDKSELACATQSV